MHLVALLLLASAVSAAPANLFPTNVGYLQPTATSDAPFLAKTDTAAIKFGRPTLLYTLPQPIETSIQSLDHKEGDRNIFELMGTISPYYVGEGWGVYDYALPDQCSIKQVHLLSRHGSRYPTLEIATGKLLANHNYTALGDLLFLQDYNYIQGVNVLTKLGNQQLFDKGVRTFFRYGDLYESWGPDNTTPHKLVARTTSQQRITATAEYFLAGFFGLDWQNYADLEIIIEASGFNDTLAPYENCPVNDDFEDSNAASKPAEKFRENYLKDAVDRFNKQLDGLTLTTKNVYEMQQLCSYEVNNDGFSPFCSLFTQKEWEDYEYYLSWTWYNNNMFGLPFGRALGIGWVQEFKQRLEQSNTFDYSTLALQNSTLDDNPATFPTNQSLYFDFTHDSVISNIFTALGLQQFKSNFSIDGSLGSKEAPFDVSTVVPFGSQTYFEIIECGTEILANRTVAPSNSTLGNHKYIHMILNDHTIPLADNIPEYCSPREDGWCDFDKFVEYLGSLWDKAEFDTCFNKDFDYTKIVEDGRPF